MSEPQRFRTKPVEIEAKLFDGTNHDEIAAFTFGCFDLINPADREGDPEALAQVFNQRHGVWIPVKPGMWIVRDMYGYYPIKAERLAEKYEPAGTPQVGDFTWGQSIGMDAAAGTIDLPFNDGERWAGTIQIGVDDAQVLHDMLGDALKQVGGGDE